MALLLGVGGFWLGLFTEPRFARWVLTALAAGLFVVGLVLPRGQGQEDFSPFFVALLSSAGVILAAVGAVVGRCAHRWLQARSDRRA